jgi:hypothetical protein
MINMPEGKTESFIAFHFCYRIPEMKLISYDTLEIDKSQNQLMPEEYEMNFHTAA